MQIKQVNIDLKQIKILNSFNFLKRNECIIVLLTKSVTLFLILIKKEFINIYCKILNKKSLFTSEDLHKLITISNNIFTITKIDNWEF